jgi:zinc transporter ZupT
MEFLLLGGMILLMGVFNKVKAMKDANKALIGLRIPIGIVILLYGIANLCRGRGVLVFPGIMGIIAGFFLILELIKLIPRAEESLEKVNTTLTAFQIPVGILTVIAAVIGMFIR